MSKQPQIEQTTNLDFSTQPTQVLQNLFIQTAQAAYALKAPAQTGNQVALAQYLQQSVFASNLWNTIKVRADFNENLGTLDNQSMAHWSLELSNNNLTIDIHEKGKTIAGNHALSFNHQDKTGRSTCFWSAVYKNKDLVQYCLQNGAKTDIRDTTGTVLKDLILANGWSDIMGTESVWDILLCAVSAQGNVISFREDQEKGSAIKIAKLKNADTTSEIPTCSISHILDSKMIPYYFACHIKSAAIANQIEKHTPVNVGNHKDSNGWGHFHWAIKLPESGLESNLKCKMIQMENLAKKNYNVNAQDNSGKTPLHYTEYLSVETASKLLELGADINLQDIQGFTPMTLACAKSYQVRTTNIEASKQAAGMACHILKVSLNNENFNFSVRDKLQNAPIGHWLLEVHNNDAIHNDIFTNLKAIGYDISLVDGNNKTLMDWSVEYKWKEAVEILHECGALVTLQHMHKVAGDADFISFLQPLCINSMVAGFEGLNLEPAGDNNSDDIDLYS